MMVAMSDPLVWLPFDPAELGEPPAGLRYRVWEADGRVPEDADEVAFYVPAYRFDKRDYEILPQLSNLQVVQTMTAGVEHVRPYLSDGVTLCNGRGIHDVSTAELAVTLTLASLSRIPEFVRAQQQEEWAYQWRTALHGSRVMIVGHGQIGAAIEARLAGFECDVVRVARRPRDGVHAIEELPGLLPTADVVILIVPGTSQTHGLFDAGMLARMRDGGLLVNVSRGAVVDSAALLAEVRSGRLRAALDVVDPEPLPPGHPLWQEPGVLISPHTGGASDALWPRAYGLITDQLTRFAAGEPLANVMTGDY